MSSPSGSIAVVKRLPIWPTPPTGVVAVESKLYAKSPRNWVTTGKLLGKAVTLALPVVCWTWMVRKVVTELGPWLLLLSVTLIDSVQSTPLVPGAVQWAVAPTVVAGATGAGSDPVVTSKLPLPPLPVQLEPQL